MARDFLVRVGLTDNPRLAEELGHLNVAWAALDLWMFYLFEALTGLPIPIARAIYYSQNTTQARINLVASVAPVVLRKRPLGRPQKSFPRKRLELGDNIVYLKKLTKHLGHVSNLAGSRNKFVHDPWLGRETNNRAYQMRLKGKEIHGEFEPVRLKELRNLVIKVERKSYALHRLYDFLAPKVRPLLDILELQIDLTLVPATKVPRRKKMKAKPRRQPQS